MGECQQMRRDVIFKLQSNLRRLDPNFSGLDRRELIRLNLHDTTLARIEYGTRAYHQQHYVSSL